MGRQNFWPYQNPMMGDIGAPSPGMVFVEKSARFTPILEFRRRFSRKNRYPPKNRQRGALAAQIRLRRSGSFGDWRASFLGVYDSTGAPSFPHDKWIFKNTGGGLSRGGNFCGNLEFPGWDGGAQKIEFPPARIQKWGKSQSRQYAFRWKLSAR